MQRYQFTNKYATARACPKVPICWSKRYTRAKVPRTLTRQPERGASFSARDVSFTPRGKKDSEESYQQGLRRAKGGSQGAGVMEGARGEGPRRPVFQLLTRREGCQSWAGPLRYLSVDFNPGKQEWHYQPYPACKGKSGERTSNVGNAIAASS